MTPKIFTPFVLLLAAIFLHLGLIKQVYAMGSKQSSPIEKSINKKTASSLSPKMKAALEEDSKTGQRDKEPRVQKNENLTNQTVLRPGMKEGDTSSQEPQTWWQRAQQASSQREKKLDDNALYQSGQDVRTNKEATAASSAKREETIATLKEQRSLARTPEEKDAINRQLYQERSQRSLSDTLEQSRVSRKIQNTNKSLGKTLIKNEKTLYGAAGAAALGGVALTAGSIALGLGATAAAKQDALQPSEASTSESSATTPSAQEFFEAVPFTLPDE